MEVTEAIEKILKEWKLSLCAKIDLGGLIARNETVYKWKAPWRSFLLREASFWRIQDLLNQSYVLHQQGYVLGARILLRSGFETLAMLIYLNQLTSSVSDGSLNFHKFTEKTSTLLLGSRNGDTTIDALNIVTILGKADKRYSGLTKLYADMSEGAHPNYEGILIGFSKLDKENHVTKFSNRWAEMYSEEHLNLMLSCIKLFQEEYDVIWPRELKKLEAWVTANNDFLEATKGDS